MRTGDMCVLCYYIVYPWLILHPDNVYMSLSISGGDLTAKMNNPITSILRYEASNDTWHEAGHMQAGRILHAVAVMEDISHLCP